MSNAKFVGRVEKNSLPAEIFEATKILGFSAAAKIRTIILYSKQRIHAI